MIRSLMGQAAAGALLVLALGAAPAVAAPCKDAKTGKFIKCTPAAAPAARCKDAKGRFAKCGAPGATPMTKK